MKTHKLLDTLKAKFNLKTDAELSWMLCVPPSSLSKMRSGMPVSAERILQIHDATGWEIKRIKGLL
jgi:DNA-binding transcriptional regulator YdaS (Cro superfamily)